MRSSRVVLATALALACAAACGDAADVAPTLAVDAGVDDGAPPKDAGRPRRDSSGLFCEPADARAAVMPPAYVGLQNPVAGDPAAVAAGRSAFANRCATCHGSKGAGDGRERPIRPPPADLTATRRADEYLFWRVSEGGSDDPFCSAMPGFKTFLAEDERWELVTFVQTLAPALDGGADASDAAAR